MLNRRKDHYGNLYNQKLAGGIKPYFRILNLERISVGLSVFVSDKLQSSGKSLNEYLPAAPRNQLVVHSLPALGFYLEVCGILRVVVTQVFCEIFQ